MSQRTRTALIVAVALCLGVGSRWARGLDLEPCTSDNDCNEGDPNQCQVCGEDGFCEQKDVTSCDDVCYTGPGAPCDENCPDEGGDDGTCPNCAPDGGGGCGGPGGGPLPGGCLTCSGGDALGVPDIPGGGGGCNGSVSFRFTLGKRADGSKAGQLWIKESKPSPLLATPRMLRYDVVRGDIEVIRDSNNVLRQVKTPQVLADVVEVVDEYMYTVKFYDRDNWGNKVDDYIDTGIAGWDPVDDGEFATWVIKNPDASPTVYNSLSIAKVLDYGQQSETQKLEYLYTYDDGSDTWTLVKRDGTTDVSEETRTSSINPISHLRTDTRVRKVDEQTVYQATEQFMRYRWGYEIVYSQIGGGSNPITLHRSYYSDAQETGNYGKIRSWGNEDGSWEMRKYDSLGRMTIQLQSWKDVSMPSQVTEGVAHAMVYSYSSVDGRDNVSVDPKNPRTVTEKIEGVVVAKTYHAYFVDNEGLKVHIEERCPDPANSYGQKDEQEHYVNLRTISRFHQAGQNKTPPERVASIEYPDGRLDSYSYEPGTYELTGEPSETYLGTFTPNETGTDVRVTVVHGATGSPDGVAYKTTKEVIVRNQTGAELRREVFAYEGGTTYTRIGWVVNKYDAVGHLTDVYRNNRTHSHNQWDGCCGLAWQIDEAGGKISYEYDGLGALTSKTKEGVSASSPYAAQDPLVTEYARTANGEGLLETTTFRNGADTVSLQASVQYDTAGRVAKRTDQSGLETTTGYSTVSGNKVVTVTRPDGSTVITTYWKDGRPKSITGTGVVHKYFDYGVTNGQRWAKTYSGPQLSTSPMWVRTAQDALGHTISEEKPGYNGATVTTTYHYNRLAQLYKTQQTNMADRLYEYDTLGNMTRSGLDVEDPGQLDLASEDRINETETVYYHDDTECWRKTLIKVYGYDNASSSSDQAITTNQQWVLLSGFEENTGEGWIETGRSRTVDIYGNTTVTSTRIKRGTNDALRLVTRLEQGPKENTLEVRAVTRNGLLQSSTSDSDLATKYAYDGLGRQIAVTDPRGNETQTEYYTSGTGSKGKVKWVLSAGNRTYYTYNADGSLSWTAVNAALDEQGGFASGKRQYTNHEYLVDGDNYAGERQRTWGETGYPVEYAFDAYGRQTEMRTWRGPETPTDYWTTGSWPQSPSGAELTQWRYEPATGLLLKKLYHGDTEQSPGISYTYTANGKMATRVWKRGITTTYSYNDGTSGFRATGELRKVDYSDTTPDVTFAHDRLGRRTTVTEGGSTTHSFAYEDDDADSFLRLDTETITRDGYTKVITRKYEDGSGSTLEGRGRGFKIGPTADSNTDYDATYAYDGKGRLEKIIGPGLDGTYGAVYARLIEDSVNTSDLVEYTYFKSSSDATLATIHRKPESTRNLVEFVENLAGSTSVSKYAYTNDELGRRMSVENSGTAFSGTAFNAWVYNERSELQSSCRYTGGYTETPDEGDEIVTQKRLYDYDHIGNRRTSTAGTSSRTYTTNDLNQYTLLTNPSEELKYYDPPSQTTTVDGNLTQDGTFTYTWDAENRLVEVQTRPEAGQNPTAYEVDDKHVYFTYDYMGRRTRKRVETYNGSSWPETSDELFVYDEWNVVLVLNANASNAITRKYTWGLDLSGSIHGAGGIGGLLATEEPQTTGESKKHWFTYDANGNVGQLLKYVAGTSTVTLAAHYEYDPYGNVIVADDVDSSGIVSANPIRFSTKWFDVETGLYYYGYRYYSPRLGRWISRDPIEEVSRLSEAGSRSDALGVSTSVTVSLFGYQQPAGSSGEQEMSGLATAKRWNRPLSPDSPSGGIDDLVEPDSPNTYLFATGSPVTVLDYLGLTAGAGCTPDQQQTAENALDAGCACISYVLANAPLKPCVRSLLQRSQQRCQNNRPHVHCDCKCPRGAGGHATSCFFGIGNHITLCTNTSPWQSWSTRIIAAAHEMAHCAGAADPPFGIGCDAYDLSAAVQVYCPLIAGSL